MTGPLILSEDRFISSPLDDGLLIARPADNRVFLFNSTARFIWERLIKGATESEIPELITTQFGIDITKAREDFNKTLRRCREYGLIRPCGMHQRYVVAGLEFDIRCNDTAVANVLFPMLAHLASDAMHPPALQIDLDCREEALVLRLNGVESGRANGHDELIANLLSELFRYVSNKKDWGISLHAAAVGIAGRCILMPGASGMGKSTLTAALLGFDDIQFAADDLVLLAGARLEVIPVPLPIVLKSGSWDALHSILPDLAACESYRRFDRDCRYWIPKRERIARKPMPVKAVVFPRYIQGTETTLTPLRPLDAFGRIISAPAAMRPPITDVALEAVASFARNVPAYTLTYGTLVEAGEIVRGLLLT